MMRSAALRRLVAASASKWIVFNGIKSTRWRLQLRPVQNSASVAIALPNQSVHAASTSVVLLRRAAAFICGLVLLHASAGAAILIHEYALRGSLADSSGGNSLTALGGDITALGYVFAANQGLTFSSHTLTPKNYSVEFSFKLDSTNGTNKLIDFHHFTTFPGLYQNNDRLAFIPFAAATVSDFTPEVNVHMVLTRDGSTNIVTVYVNGESRFSFLDALDLAVPLASSNKITFLTGDGIENASG